MESLTSLPRFPLGFPLRVGYMGLHRADDQECNSAGEKKDYANAIDGIRLIPEPFETEDMPEEGDPRRDAVSYPKGWEYHVARFTESGQYREWGWIPEAELIQHGYGEAQEIALIEVAKRQMARECEACGQPETEENPLTHHAGDALAPDGMVHGGGCDAVKHETDAHADSAPVM